jgi:hypothetical protein
MLLQSSATMQHARQGVVRHRGIDVPLFHRLQVVEREKTAVRAQTAAILNK